MLNIYVDADACPVKEEANRVAKRYQLSLTYIANAAMRLPDADSKLIVVDGLPNAADDWIVEHVEPNDIVVTGDIPLAYRCIKKGARAVANNGDIFSEENIGQLLATRDLMTELRESGTISASGFGPKPFQKQDRSRFLHALDQLIQQIKKHRT